MRAQDPKYMSPFASSALSNNLLYMGGKLDDITVIVTYVSAAKGGDEADGSAGETPTSKL
jgi:hypothetical protein